MHTGVSPTPNSQLSLGTSGQEVLMVRHSLNTSASTPHGRRTRRGRQRLGVLAALACLMTALMGARPAAAQTTTIHIPCGQSVH